MARTGLAAALTAAAVPTGVAAVLVFGCACGTMQNNGSSAGPPSDYNARKIYGGVRLDVKDIGKAAGSLVCPKPGDHDQVFQMVFFTLDLPLSAAADTLALPFNIADTIRRSQDGGRPAGPFLPAPAAPATADSPANH